MRKVVTRALVIVCMCVVGMSLGFGVLWAVHGNFLRGSSGGAVVPASNTPQPVVVGRPVRLVIPKIKLDAAVEYVGLTKEGAMDVPKGPAGVAWFDLGVRPGEVGSAVISGHYGWKNGIPAAFDRLSVLQKGDVIQVIDEKGATTTFVVHDLQSYDQQADSTDIFFSNDGNAHLNLITCEGVWDALTKSYSKRLVVFADKR